MIADLQIEAFVLAGGKSSRMGRDKGLADFRGKPMISFVLGVLAKFNLPVSIIAHQEDYTKFGYPVYQDPIRDKGPMGGLLTAFENTKAEIVLLLSCDMPFISEEAVSKMLLAADSDRIVTASDDQRLHPLFGTYPVLLQQKLREQILAGNLKMRDFILKNPHSFLAFGIGEEEGVFRNINTEKELREAEWKQ